MAAMLWRLVLDLLLLAQVAQVRSHTLYQWLVDSKTRFNYDTDPNNRLGVYNWKYTYPDSCAGEFQSPVDIQTDKVRYEEALPCPQMLYTSSVLRGELKNNGQSATFEPEGEMSYRLTDIPYRPGIYNLNDFHFHFGGIKGRIFEMQGQRFRGDDVMSAGSEHTIDGLRFEGEVHFVFYNLKYKDLETADNKTDGVVVVSLLVQKVPDNTVENDGTISFSEFLMRNIPRVAKYKQNATTEVDLSMFFNRACQFYTYFGSTTTPFCRQAVQWLILREPIKVKERAWNQLTRLESRGDFNFRFGNYRNTQPLNNRVIVANFPREAGPVLPSPNDQFVRPRSEIFRNPDRGAMRRQRQMFRNNAMRIPNSVLENTVMQARGPMFLTDPIRAQPRIMNDKRSTVRSRMPMRNALQASRNIGRRGQSLLMPPAGPFRRVNMVYKPMIREAERFIRRDYRLPSRSIYSRKRNLVMAPELNLILQPMHGASTNGIKMPVPKVVPIEIRRQSMARRLRGSSLPLPIILDQPIKMELRPPPLEMIRRNKYSSPYDSYANNFWTRLCDLNRKIF